MSMLFNILSRLVIVFLPRSKHLSISRLQSQSAVILEPKKIKSLIVSLHFFALIAEEGFLIAPCCSLEICIQMDISFLFSFAFHFSFHSSLLGLPRQPFCFFAFLFHGDGLDPCLLYDVMNLCPIVHQALYLSDLVP